MREFTVKGNDFVRDGEPFRIIAGAMHYFRTMPEQWRDRLAKARLCGLNAVETYVAWNLHEPRPGQFDFDGGLDLVAYLRRAEEQGLLAIVRPGPYICAEWEFGGLPAWLLADPTMKLRCFHRHYLDAVERYLDALLPPLAPLQYSRGGPIVAMQVENEYGSYGNDSRYLRWLEQAMRDRGIDCLLFTSDGPTDTMLQGGTLPDVLKVVNFGSGATPAFAKLRQYQPTGPLMCGEFWDGWFDHWGEEHHVRPPEDAAATLGEMLSAGASASIYMFHGGTNFGFMNGANDSGRYQPTVTSYDYDAPLTEAGDVTPKWEAFRRVIGKYAPLPEAPVPAPSPKLAPFSVELTECAPLFANLDALSRPLQRVTPEPMEMLGQNYGFVLYRTEVNGPRPLVTLAIREVRDRAQVFVDGAVVGVIERDVDEGPLVVDVPAVGARLDLLVENMGRTNYGPALAGRKGITEGVLLANQYLYHWDIYPLPLDVLSGLRYRPVTAVEGPAFYRGHFSVSEPRDGFLALPGWDKGVVFVNGFNLGRYWSRGPQKTLYVPWPVLRPGDNEIVVFELHEAAAAKVEVVAAPEP
ncbi:MAG: glycoside hydrolase family 35 protein [Anaerolineae bacterium]